MVKFISYVGLGIHTWHANLTEHKQNLCCLMGNCSHLHKLINQSVSSQGLIVWKMWLNLSGRCNCKNSTHNMWQWSIWQSRWLLNFAEEPIIVATSEIFLEQGSCGHGKHEKCGEKNLRPPEMFQNWEKLCDVLEILKEEIFTKWHCFSLIWSVKMCSHLRYQNLLHFFLN